MALPIVVSLIWLAVALPPLALGKGSAWILAGTQGAILGAAGCWLLRLLGTRQTELVATPVTVSLLIGATFAVVRYSLTEPEHPARSEMLLAVTAVLLFFLVLHSLRHHEHLGRLVGLWVGLGTLVAGAGLAQVAAEAIWLGPGHGPRPAQAWFAAPGDFAGFLELVLPLGLAWSVFSRHSARARLLVGLGCGVMAVGVVASLDEAAWFGVLTSLVVLSFFLVRKRGVRPRWALLGSILLGLLALLAVSALQWQQTPGQEPPHGPLWQAALAMGREQPLLGVGTAMFPWQFAAYRTVPGNPADPQCEYLRVFSQYGLAGVAAVLWVVIMFGVALVRVVRARAARYSASAPSNRYAFAVGIMAAAAGLAAHTLFAGPLHNPANLYTLMAMLAVALTCGVHPTGKVDDDVIQPGRFQTVLVRRSSRWVLIAGVAVVVAMIGALWLRTYPAALLGELADRQARRLNWSAAHALYERAWAADRRSDRVAAAAGDCWLARGTWQRTKRNNPAEEARRWYERAYALNAWRLDVLPKLGRTQELAGNAAAAEDWYRRAVAADPRNPAFHTELGLYLVRAGEPGAARESFARALQLDPTDPVAAALVRGTPAP